MYGSKTSSSPSLAVSSEMVMLKIRTEAWEAQKHPFFKDRVLYNKHLVKLYQSGIISKEDVSEGGSNKKVFTW